MKRKARAYAHPMRVLDRVRVQAFGVTEHEARVGPATVLFYVDDRERLVEIASLRVPQSARGVGAGRAALQYALSIADDLHYRTSLLASPLDKRTNLGRLVRFYMSEGFELTGRSSAAFHPFLERAARDEETSASFSALRTSSSRPEKETSASLSLRSGRTRPRSLLHSLEPMSVRYSGDTEIRLHHNERDRRYEGVVVDPYLRFRGWVPTTRKFARDPQCSDAYDDAAKRLAALAERWARSERRRFMIESTNNGIRIRRGFQSPCPLEDL